VKQDYRELLQPHIINSVKGLAIIARVIIDGFMSGAHNSRKVGPGLEFSQYRGYQPGDDMRLLDWKMLARSGKYFIKESDVDTQVSVKFIIDASASMAYKEDNLSKIDYVRVLIASLGYLSHNQGDAVGLYILNNLQLKSLKPTLNKQHFNRFLQELINIELGGKFPDNRNDLQIIQQGRQKELLFFVTDMHEKQRELTHWVQQLKTSRNEVVVLHVLGERELTFSYSGAVVFEDLETKKRVKVNTKDTKQKYLDALQSDLKEIRSSFLNKDIGYDLFSIDSPIEEALQLFLKKRITLS
jgi:uncharacterized protein (DUF58 family)